VLVADQVSLFFDITEYWSLFIVVIDVLVVWCCVVMVNIDYVRPMFPDLIPGNEIHLIHGVGVVWRPFRGLESEVLLDCRYHRHSQITG